MTRFEYIVFSMALLVPPLLSPFYLINATSLPSPPRSTEDQPPTPNPSGLPSHPSQTDLPIGFTDRTRYMEEMESRLAINQLAILHILNGDSSGSECNRTPEVEGLSEVLEDLRRLKEDLAVLRESQTTFLWRQSELRESLTEVRESQAEMRDDVKILEGSIGEVKVNHDLLNVTLASHNYSLGTLKSHVSVHTDSLGTLTDHIGTLDGHVENITYHIGSLDGHVGNLHNRTMMQNITVGTMMKGVQTLHDNLRLLQNGSLKLREEYDAHQEDFFYFNQYAGTFFLHESKKFFMNTKSNLTWAGSRQWCQARGGDLAQPIGDLTIFLQEVLKRSPAGQSNEALGVWLGASDEEQEGQWLWSSGTSLPSDFPWGTGQPNNYNNLQNCLEIWYNQDKSEVYNDRECSHLKYSVCEV